LKNTCKNSLLLPQGSAEGPRTTRTSESRAQSAATHCDTGIHAFAYS
jgi:hypothetical protein